VVSGGPNETKPFLWVIISLLLMPTIITNLEGHQD